MADRTIGSLPRAAGLYDDSLLVMEQQGAAMSLSGGQIKSFARAGVSDYVEAAQQAAQDALEAVGTIGDAVEEAQTARDAARTAQEGAEEAREAIEDLEVTADTLPTGTPASVEKTSREGHVLLRFGLPTGEQGPKGDTGSSIQKIERTAGTGAAGTVDTYTVTLTDGTTTTFQVRNGADGQGAGDMTASVYDPRGLARDVFAYADALLPVIHAVTLPAEGWEGEEEPFLQSVAVPGVLADETAQIIQIQPSDRALWAECGLVCTGQGAGTLAFSARDKPGEAVALLVSVQAARKGGAAV